MNADSGTEPIGGIPSQNRSKNRRRRRKNRQQKSENGVQAEIDNSKMAVSQQAGIPVQEPSNEGGGDRGASGATNTGPQGKNKRPRRNNREWGNGNAQSNNNAKSQNRGRSRVDAYAALDLGTNNCRLLVAVPQQPGRFKVVDAFSKIVRLGEGLAATGKLSDNAMDRAVEALKACAGKLENRNVRGVRLIATEACRRALNGEEFLRRVEIEAGLKLEIISQEAEAKLAVAGCSSLVDRESKGVVLFDIGGGSSELALLDLRGRKHYDLSRSMVSWTSLPLGVVTLSEKYGGGKQVTRPVFESMVQEVEELLANFEGRHALEEAASQGEIHLLGTSGTVTTLAGIHLKLPKYDRRQVDGVWMASKDVGTIIDELVDMSFEERVESPCIGHDRADLVLAGCAILLAIQNLWPYERLRVADRGLREGLLTEMMNADNAWRRRPRNFRKRRGKPNNNNSPVSSEAKN